MHNLYTMFQCLRTSQYFSVKATFITVVKDINLPS